MDTNRIPAICSLSMTTKAFSYRRYSDEKQKTGSSLARQLKMATDYCAAHGLELDQTLKLTDTAISAFKGKNRETGALSEFLQAIVDGEIPSGSQLLVESFDRLSREGWWETASLCQKIASAGVSIVVLKSQRVYDKEMLNSLEGGITLVVEACLAAEESRQKARRVREAWVDRKTKAVEEGTNIGEAVPSWLSIPPKIKGVADTRKITINPARQAVVLRIIKEYLAGVGKQTIANGLNNDKVPCFSDTQKRTLGKAQWWSGTIIRILRSPALIGHYLERTDYFPALIDIETWNDIRTMERNSHKRMTPRHNTLSNPLSGVASCLCGSIMTRICTTIGEKRYYRLTCMARKSGKADHARYSIDYPKTIALMRNVLPNLIDEAPIADAGIEDELVRINEAIGAVQGQIDRLLDVVAHSVGNDSAIVRITALEAVKKELGVKLAEVHEEAQTASPASQRRRRAELIGLLVSDEATDPQTINAKLKLVIAKIVFDVDGSIKTWAFTGSTDTMNIDPDEASAELRSIAYSTLIRD